MSWDILRIIKIFWPPEKKVSFGKKEVPIGYIQFEPPGEQQSLDL